jgi:hypothetical protein
VPLPPPQAPRRAYRSGQRLLNPAALCSNTNASFAREVEWKDEKLPEKLDMDFVAWSVRLAVMDDDAELMGLLCTRIGMIMEDASVIALTLAAADPEARLVQLAELKAASAAIAALVAAVESLN